MKRISIAMSLLMALSLFASGPVEDETLSFPFETGTIVARYSSDRDSEPKPAVLLLHQAGLSKEEWNFLAPRLRKAGYQVLCLDLFGHGASVVSGHSGGELFYRIGTDPNLMPPVLSAVLNWLAERPEVDGTRIAVLGSGVGGSLAYLASGQNWPVKTAIALSADAENVASLTAGQSGFAPGNIFLIAGRLPA